jgi:hypothetical protein
MFLQFFEEKMIDVLILIVFTVFHSSILIEYLPNSFFVLRYQWMCKHMGGCEFYDSNYI